MRPEPVECALSLSKGTHRRGSTGAVLSLSKGSAHIFRRGLSGAGSGGFDEMTEDLSLHGICGGGVFWMPLDAQVPASMIL